MYHFLTGYVYISNPWKLNALVAVLTVNTVLLKIAVARNSISLVIELLDAGFCPEEVEDIIDSWGHTKLFTKYLMKIVRTYAG